MNQIIIRIVVLIGMLLSIAEIANGQNKDQLRIGSMVYVNTSLRSIYDESCIGVSLGYKHRTELSRHLDYYCSVDLLINRTHESMPDEHWEVYDNTSYYAPLRMTIPTIAGLDYKFAITPNCNVLLGAGAGINIMLNSDRFYYSWGGGQDNYAYSEFLGKRKPSANIAAELCAAVTFGKFEFSLRYTNFGLHSDEVQEYYASKTQIYDIAPNHIIRSTNIYAARYYAVSLTVGYAF